VIRVSRPGLMACAALLLAVGSIGALAACDEVEDEARDQAEGTAPETVTAPPPEEVEEESPPVEPAECPPDLAGCRSASGIVIFVERVDPDGDGDAHFVLDSEEGITAEGLSVIDVRRDLRPDPLPGPGDWVSAAGPVHRGSYGQRQIEAVVVHASYTGAK
jgi:hypothetical protein